MKPEISKWFETAKRADGQHKDESDATYVRVVEGAPAWILDAVRKAHRGMFPNDWVFAECEAAAEAIENLDEVWVDDGDEDWIIEHVDGRVDVYTKSRFQWATDFCLTEIFGDAEEESADLYDSNDTSIGNRLGVIQSCAIDGIVRTMLEAFNEQRENEEDETNEEQVES